MEKQQDPYMRHVSEIDTTWGTNAFDAALRLPGPSLLRTYECIDDTEQKDFPKSRNHVLCKGAAVGLDESGQCCHMVPGMKFMGFLEAQTETRAGVRTRGSVVLQIEGVVDSDVKKPVYCSGANDFSLDKKRGSSEIGKIRYIQNGRAAVAFKRFDDDRPLSLDVGRAF